MFDVPSQAVSCAADMLRSLADIGIDRPGYGLSSLRPGRSIADFVPDGLAVVDLSLIHI